MKTICRLIAVLVLLTGCATLKETYSIHNLKAKTSLTLKKQSVYPEEIIDIDDDTFRIFTRSGEGFEVWDVHFDGTLAAKFSGRTFSDHISRYYGLFKEGFAVAPDASQIAYFDLPSGEVRLFNLIDSTEDTLLTDVATNELSVAWLEWRSRNELIVGVSAWVGEEARFLMVNTDSKEVVFELDSCPTAEYSANNALSHDKRFLALQERCGGASSNGSFRIYDIVSRKDVGVVAARHSIVERPHWSEADDAFVYVDGSDLMEYSVVRNESKCIRSYSKEVSVDLFGFAQGKVLYAAARHQDIGESPLYVYDIARQKGQRIEKLELNGQVFVSPSGEFVITGWGY